MKTVENQKVIVVMKDKQKGDNKPFSVISEDAIRDAMHNLNGSELKLWLYLGNNQNEYKFALSAVDFCNFSGVSRSSYKRAVQKLLEEKYLIPKDGNTYIFYEKSLECAELEETAPIIEIPDAKKQQINNFEF